MINLGQEEFEAELFISFINKASYNIFNDIDSENLQSIYLDNWMYNDQ